MSRWEKTMRDDLFRKGKQTPSFSSNLLDQIYRSIDNGDNKSGQTMASKQCKINVRENSDMKQRLPSKKIDRNYKHFYDYDHDATFFGSTSNSSSDSSSGGFSSSDTESMYGSSTTGSCFAPRRPKPVLTTGNTLFYQQREFRASPEPGADYNTKSRALKKVKQPISPGGRVIGFLNSIFTAGNVKKTKNFGSKSVPESTCSSASSFSRSCLSKHSPSTRERLRNEVKRRVRFYPVSVIVDENCRPCGHKSLQKEEDSVPSSWKIGRSESKKKEEKHEFQAAEKSRRVEDAAREFLREYYRNQKERYGDDYGDEEEEEDDDALSCSSSDLFELDHLSIIGNNDIDRYQEELPVYETTRVCRNRNGLIM